MNTTDTQVMRNRQALRDADARRSRMLCSLFVVEVGAFLLVITMELVK